MKKHLKIGLVFGLLLLSLPNANARPRSKTHNADPSPPSTTVDIPGSHLIVNPTPTPVPEISWINFGVNTYSPGSLNLPSRFASANNFSRIGFPGLFVNYLRPIFGGDFNFKAGLNWLGLSRTATITSSGTTSTGEQDANLFSVRLGIEYSPEKLAGPIFSPYLGASILPSFVLSGRSACDDGSTYFGLPVEFALGTRVKLSGIGLPFENTDLDFSVNAVAGSVKGSSAGGIGAGIGLRVGL